MIKKTITAAGPQKRDVYIPFKNQYTGTPVSKVDVKGGYAPWPNATHTAQNNLIVSNPTILSGFFKL